MNFNFSLYFFFTYFFVVKADYHKCEEISVISANPANDQDVIFSATFHTSSNNDGKNILTLMQFTKGNVPFTNNSQNYSICFNFGMECFKKVNDSIIVENGFLSIGAFPDLYPAVREAETYMLFYGPLNEGNFAFYDGRMFTEKDKCLTYPDIDSSWLFDHTAQNIKTCCTSFQTITTNPTNAQKCTNFKILSTFFNFTDNNIIATINTNFMLSETDITGKGQFSKIYSPYEMALGYAINGMPCQSTSTNSQYCHYPIDGEDRTLIFSGNANVPSYSFAASRPFAGKLIIYDGQTLIAEGIPFTSKNNCQNFTQLFVINDPYYGLNWTANFVSQFCCTSFDGILPSPVVPVQTNLTEQKCNSIQTSATTTNFTLSANLAVTALNDTFNVVTINNINMSTALNVKNVYICADEFISDVGLDPIRDQCLNFSTSLNFNVKNEPLQFYVFINDVGYRSMFIFFYGMIDKENFISFDGLLFDMNNQKCSNYKSQDLSVTSCCSAFNQTKSLQAITQPQCTNFEAISTLYNTTDNNSIYSITSAKFIFDGTDLIAIGDFSETYAPVYSINGYPFEFGINGSQFGGFPVSSNSSEFLIHLIYKDFYYAVIVGRILLFDGQTFMDQNNLYTPKNNCYNFSAPYDFSNHKGITAASQLCCRKFADFDADGSTTSVNSPTTSAIKVTTTTSSSSSSYSISFGALAAIFVKFCGHF